MAVSDNGVIGKDNELPWYQKNDLQRFRQLTRDHALIMGRKTYESLPGILKGRPHIVLTQDEFYEPEFNGLADDDIAPIACNSIQELMIWHKVFGEKSFVIGGATICKLLEDYCDTLYLTRIHATIKGDTFLELSGDWKQVHDEQQKHKADLFNEYDYTYETYTKEAKKHA